MQRHPLPPLGEPIICLLHKDILVAAQRCFDACPELDRILMLWETPGFDIDDQPCGQSCDLTWKMADGKPITPKTSGITDAFKAAAWDFDEWHGRAIQEFGDTSMRQMQSSWRIGRNGSIWMFTDDDFRNDPLEYAYINGRSSSARELKPVFVGEPTAHELIAAIARLETDMPRVFEALTNPDLV